MSIPQNGQTHSNNSSATADEMFAFGHFVKLAPKGLMVKVTGNSTHKNTKWLKSYYIKIIRSVTESKASIAKVFLHELNNQQFEAT